MTNSEARTLPGVIWFGMDEVRNGDTSLGFKDFRPNPAAPEVVPQKAAEAEVPKEPTPPTPEEIHPSSQETPENLETPVEQETNQTGTENPTTTQTTHPDLDF